MARASKARATFSHRAYSAEAQKLLVRGDERQIQYLCGGDQETICRTRVEAKSVRREHDFMGEGRLPVNSCDGLRQPITPVGG